MEYLNRIIIGIETTCDETSVALMKNDKVIDEITISSSKTQSLYGGVVPEIATRSHQKNIHKMFNEILNKNNININNINAIAYADNPGLPGCLHVGKCFSKTMSNLLNIPIIPVNHLYGHLFSPFINNEQKIEFPILGLVISGGNTIIYLVNNYKDIIILNDTKDDAIGEVYDKVSRALGMGYPGGAKIDNLYDETKANINFLKNNLSESAQFSFSGIKTSVLSYINQFNMKNIEIDLVSIASSFQKCIIDDVIKKVRYYCKKYDIKYLTVGGGVSANKYLRNELKKLDFQNIYISELKYTGDQASMIVYYGSKIL